MKARAPLLSLALALSLAACAPSGPNPRYYVLSGPAAPASSAVSGPRLGVLPVTMPGYLDRPQLVTRDANGVGIHVDAFSRWGEELSLGVSRLLCESLAAHGRPAVSLRTGARTEERLVVEVLRFDGTPGGSATLDALWTLQRRGRILASGRTVLEEAAGKDTESLIQAQSKLVFRLGSALAEALPPALPAETDEDRRR